MIPQWNRHVFKTENRHFFLPNNPTWYQELLYIIKVKTQFNNAKMYDVGNIVCRIKLSLKELPQSRRYGFTCESIETWLTVSIGYWSSYGHNQWFERIGIRAISPIHLTGSLDSVLTATLFKAQPYRGCNFHVIHWILSTGFVSKVHMCSFLSFLLVNVLTRNTVNSDHCGKLQPLVLDTSTTYCGP